MSSGSHRSENTFGGAAQSWAHHADLVMYARRVLGDRSDTAEDIVQEAFLRLLGLAASDEAPTSARPWLFRVVRNLAIDERRSVARRADPVADTAILGTAALDDTASLVEDREELADAFRDIAALPPRERKALEMDQAGIGAQAIAAELGTTPNAVHQALFRARKRLRSGRAVAWGLIPIGLAPLALRLSDPALAMTFTNLPPGVPVGRALPVAGLVAAAMVSGSVVAPSVDPVAPGAQPIAAAVQSAAAKANSLSRTASTPVATPVSAPAKATPVKTSSSGSKSEDDTSDDTKKGRNRGSGKATSGDDGDSSGSSGSGRSRRGSVSGKASSGSDDDGNDGSSSRQSGKHKSGKGKSGSDDSSTTPTASSDDIPDEPDAPDDGDSGKGK